MGRSRGSGRITEDDLTMQAEITGEARRLNQERPVWHELPEWF